MVDVPALQRDARSQRMEAQGYRAGDAGADDAGHRGLLQLRENYERTCGEDGMQPDDENKEGRLEHKI